MVVPARAAYSHSGDYIGFTNCHNEIIELGNIVLLYPQMAGSFVASKHSTPDNGEGKPMGTKELSDYLHGLGDYEAVGWSGENLIKDQRLYAWFERAG